MFPSRKLRSRGSLVASVALCVFGTRSAVGAQSAYLQANPTAQEQYLLELVNRGRLDPAGEAARSGIDLNEGLAPGTISVTPKQPLAMNANLLESARGHSQWMLDNDMFSHFGAGGNDPSSRMRAAGYSFTGSWTLGENIAWKGSSGTINLNSVVADLHKGLFVDAGIADRGHRVNLESDSFREVGMGVKQGVFTSNGVNYNAGMITEDFAKSDAQGPFLLGVIYRDTDNNKFYTPGEGLAGVTVTPGAGNYYATTADAGGFALPVAGLTGSLSVTISGGPLGSSYTKTVLLTGKNVKVDFNTAVDLPDAPSITLSPPQIVGRFFTFHVSGAAGWQVAVEMSSDFVHWQQSQVLSLDATGGTFSEGLVTVKGSRFYRAKKL